MATLSRFEGAAVFALAICMVALMSCAVKPAVTVTDADAGTRIEIKQGEVLAVRLSAQLGTGFGWKVVDPGGILEVKGDPEQITGQGQKPGGPEFQTFKFKAVKKGESMLRLNYIEAWKKEARPIKEYVLTVKVK